MISVVVCTYSRNESLRRCLSAFEELLVPSDLNWEIIVLDNNSSDTTSDVLSEFRDRKKLPLTYMFEARQGKSYALNRGVTQSRGNLIAFVDDDCLVEKNWLRFLNEEFHADPTLSGIGGRVELYDSQDKPVAIRTLKQRTLLGSSASFSLISGCNMAFRRTVFDAIGGFDEDFGPGTGLVVEDADFVYRTLKYGFKIVYCPDVIIYHNHGRRRDEQIHALNFSYVAGRGAFYCKHILSGDSYVLKIAYWELQDNARDLCRKLVHGYSIKEECLLLLALLKGSIYELLIKVQKHVRRSDSTVAKPTV